MKDTGTRLDGRFSFTVERCIDSPDWVWTLLYDGQNMSDGYEATKREAIAKARQAHREHLEYLADPTS